MAQDSLVDGTELPAADKEDVRNLPESALAKHYLVASELNPLIEVVTDLRSRFTESAFNVKSYGATGDGTTDDTEAIVAAFEACGTAGGGAVFFPFGTYRVTSTIAVPQVQNVVIYGDGGATLHGDGIDGGILSISGSPEPRGLRIRDLTLSGDGSTGTVDGIETDGVSNIRLNDLKIRELRYGLHLRHTHDSLGLYGLEFFDNDTDVKFDDGTDLDQCSSLQFVFCRFTFSKRAIHSETDLVDIGFFNCGFHGARQSDGNALPVQFEDRSIVGLTFERCRFEQGVASTLAATNLWINGLSSSFPALGVCVSNCYFTGANVTDHINLGASVLNARIEGNVFYTTPSGYDVLVQCSATFPAFIRENTVSPHLSRDMQVSVTTLSANQRGEIRAIRRVNTVTAPLTSTGIKTINISLATLNIPSWISRVELHPQSFSTAKISGLAVTKANAALGGIDIQYEVLTAAAVDGSLIVVAYGY